MVQLEFETGELATEFTWDTIVLLLKGGGEYRGIGLLEDLFHPKTDIFSTRALI